MSLKAFMCPDFNSILYICLKNLGELDMPLHYSRITLRTESKTWL